MVALLPAGQTSIADSIRFEFDEALACFKAWMGQ